MPAPFPQASVVIPVHNREQLVVDAISSVRQTTVDVEIIVVDDGSDDHTARIVGDMALRDPSVRLLRQPRSGPAAARNAGVASARGEFLSFADSDDLCAPGKLERQICKLEDHPELVAVVGAVAGFKSLDGQGNPLCDPEHPRRHNAALQAATFRTERFRGYGELAREMRFAEDVDYFLRLLEADAPLLLEPEIACMYRFHEHNMTRRLDERNQGYVRAYARSLARRRQAGRSGPLRSFFNQVIQRDMIIGG
ncbi:glycosyltransferase family A protein [Sphingomonas sp. HF-S3]|uniref:Glycosyltransferase family A protein n=1 Tax=Sphingomonas rustica TaxID=3103142 RepID=A0ABV0B5A5_9SPHN